MTTLDRVRSHYPATNIHEYLLEEDEMGDSSAQTQLLGYLEALFKALYGVEGPYVGRNLTMLHLAVQNSQNSITPDISLFLGIPLPQEERRTLKSWDMRPSRPAQSRSARLRSLPPEDTAEADGVPQQRPCPPVMIEVSSDSTWKADIHMGLEDKVVTYGKMGVQLYLAYDPNEPPVWRRVNGRRLLGWHYDAQGEPHLIEPDDREWLWCAEIDSWVGEDDYLLRLYDRAGQQRLTGEEQTLVAQRAAEERARAEQQARQQAEEQARVEAQARQQAEEQARAEQQARQQAEVAQHEAEERAVHLARLLHEHGIDPDSH